MVGPGACAPHRVTGGVGEDGRGAREPGPLRRGGGTVGQMPGGPTSHLPWPSTRRVLSASPTLSAHWRRLPPGALSSRAQDGTEPVTQGRLRLKFWVVKAAHVAPHGSAPHPGRCQPAGTEHRPCGAAPVSCTSCREYLLSWLFPKWVTDSRRLPPARQIWGSSQLGLVASPPVSAPLPHTAGCRALQ